MQVCAFVCQYVCRFLHVYSYLYIFFFSFLFLHVIFIFLSEYHCVRTVCTYAPLHVHISRFDHIKNDLFADSSSRRRGLVRAGDLGVLAPGFCFGGVSKSLTRLHLQHTKLGSSRMERQQRARRTCRAAQAHRHSGGVHEALVEVFLSSVRVVLRFKPHEAELAELPVLGELQRAVRHGPEGREHRAEPLLLHLHTTHAVTNHPHPSGGAQHAADTGGILTPSGRFFTMSLDILIVLVNPQKQHKLVLYICQQTSVDDALGRHVEWEEPNSSSSSTASFSSSSLSP